MAKRRVRWIFPLSKEEKLKYKGLVPKDMQSNPFLQRMYYTDPEAFEKLVTAKSRKKLNSLFD